MPDQQKQSERSACRFNATQLGEELQATRRAFGYDYKRKDHAPPRIAALWAECAPWVTNTMVPMASNAREAAAHIVGIRMPVHDLASEVYHVKRIHR